MPITEDNYIERSRLALLNALGLDAPAAAKGLLSPDKLSPEEKKSLSERLGISKDNPLHHLVDAASNPFILLGVGLSAVGALPIDKLDEISVYANTIKQAVGKFPGARWVYNAYRMLADKRGLKLALEDTLFSTSHYNELYNRRSGFIIGEWEKATGRKYTHALDQKIFLAQQGLDQKTHPFWFDFAAEKGASRLPDFAKLQVDDVERKLATDLQKLYRQAYGESTAAISLGITNPADADAIARRMTHHIGVHGVDEIQMLDKFAPRVLSRWFDDVQREVPGHALQDLEDVYGARFASKTGAMGQASGSFAGTLHKRKGALIPESKSLRKYGLISDDTAEALDSLRGNGRYVGTYETSYVRAASKYHYGLSRMRGFMAPPPSPSMQRMEGVDPTKVQSPGRRILAEYLDIMKSGDHREPYMREVLLPMISGQMTPKQAAANLRWEAAKEWTAGLLSKLPENAVSRRMLDVLNDPTRLRHGAVMSGVTRSIAAGALGLPNPVPTLQNLLQGINTMAVAGPKAYAEGVSAVAERSNDFIRHLKSARGSGASFEQTVQDALRGAFREYYESSPIAAMEFASGMTDAMTTHGIGKPGPWQEGFEKVVKSLLIPFTSGEKVNRLTAFYSGWKPAMERYAGRWFTDPRTGERVLGKGENLKKIAGIFGDEMVQRTQFGGGPLGRPAALADVNPAVGQFMSFPLNTLGMLIQEGTGPAGRGFLGRMALGGGVAYEAVKGLTGADISGAMLLGPAPEPRDRGPFAPLPVSPAIQALGALGLDLAQGELEWTTKTLPVLVPGGLGLAKLSTAAAPGVAKALGRPHVDWERPLPDGRVPVFTGSGSLQGYYTPTQVWAKSVGLGDVTGAKEQELAKWLVAQRDQIRGYKSQYMEAMVANDVSGMRAIEAEYERRYPGLGGIKVSKQEISTAQLRRDMPRLERIIASMPAGAREAFGLAVSTGLGAAGPEFLGMDPATMGQQPPSKMPRDAMQRPDWRQLPSGLTGGMQQGTSAQLSKQLGEQRRDELSYRALEGY